MDRKNQKTKRVFNLKGVWDGLSGFRQSISSTSPKTDIVDVEETLRSEHFHVAKTVRHGFPYQPTAMAYDPVQNLLAIGTRSGVLRIFGRPGVDCCSRQENGVAIIQVLFLVNEGALVTITVDDQLHLWTLRQKKPEIVHSLKFQRERITYCQLPFQSKWLYIGTERGNVHIVNIESFVLSGYVINWNKAIELSRKTHPGAVVHLSDNPVDPNKLLIGFESGAIVMWDLKCKTADMRYNCTESLRSISWHHEGKQFMCSHSDGSLTTWNIRAPLKPAAVLVPHAKIGKDGKPDPCRPITKVEWKTVRNGEPYVIFSGGMPYDKASRTPSLTVMHAKNTTVLEMEHNVVDFLTLCNTPWNMDFQDPYGIVVLLQNDLVVVDLTSPGYPCFENPYPMDIHESTVTSCHYLANCPADLIPAFYSVGSKQKRSGFSEKEWPVKGGEWGTTACSYPEILITGHADGSIKFWDASAVTLQVLYKLKTAKVFERHKCRGPDADDDPFAIQQLYVCAESRLLCVAGLTHVLLFKFSKQESSTDCTTLEISIVYEIYDELDSPEVEYPPVPPPKPQQSGSMGSYSSSTSDGKESITSVKVKSGCRKWGPGYQPDLCMLLTWIDGEPPPTVTSICINSRYGLLAFGNECGLAIVDMSQKTCLLNMGTPDLYGSMDPYSRAPRSPKSRGGQYQSRPSALEGGSYSQILASDDIKSPTTDQCPDTPISGGPPPSPTRHKHKSGTSQTSGQALGCINENEVFSEDKEVPLAHKNFDSSESSVELGLEASEDVVDGCEIIENFDINNWECDVSISVSGEDETEVKDNGQVVSETAKKAKPPRPPPPKRPLQLSKSLPLGAVENAKEEEKSLQPAVPQGRLSIPSGGRISPRLSPAVESAPDLTAGCQQESSDETDSEKHKKRKGSLFKAFSRRKESGASSKSSSSLLVNTQSSDSGASDQGNGMQDQNIGTPSISKSSKSETDLFIMDKDNEEIDNAEQEMLAALHEMQAQQQPPSPSTHTGGTGIPPPNKRSFVRRMSQKIRTSLLVKHSDDAFEGPEGRTKKNKMEENKFEIIDLTMEDVPYEPPRRKINYISHATFDKGDGSFSRSRSSSMSSLENVSKEAISCVVFADAYARKSDQSTCPCLWVGTTLGSVLVNILQLLEGESRKKEPVIISPSGTIFRLKGAIKAVSFLDTNGVLIPAQTDTWKDSRTQSDERKYNRQQSTPSMKARMSPTSSTDQPCDRQFAIICSEKQARVMSMPSQTCAYKVKITETSVVTQAEVTELKDSVCLACYIANGHVMTFSLPSLKPLLDIDYVHNPDERIAKTFNFSNNGHALYFCSPTEVQKISISADIGDNLNDMLGELFLPCEAPEAPRKSFFTNLFSGGANTLDREELFGESSGKASKGVAKYQAGNQAMAQAQERAGGACSEIARAKMAAIERGEKLGKLDDTTEQMRLDAEEYAKNAHLLMQKYRDKKWYQF